MSRGHGRAQRYLLELLKNKPMTFAEIRRIAAEPDIVWYTPDEQSLRRALRKLMDEEVVIITGCGGPGDLARYQVRRHVVGH